MTNTQILHKVLAVIMIYLNSYCCSSWLGAAFSVPHCFCALVSSPPSSYGDWFLWSLYSHNFLPHKPLNNVISSYRGEFFPIPVFLLLNLQKKIKQPNEIHYIADGTSRNYWWLEIDISWRPQHDFLMMNIIAIEEVIIPLAYLRGMLQSWKLVQT